jgi:hypothetical protein
VAMADVNPYEPPREVEPLTTGKLVKRGIGIVTILLLSPVAIFAAFFVSCAVAWTATGAHIDEPEPPLFWVITLIPTALVAVGMVIYAVRVLRRRP